MRGIVTRPTKENSLAQRVQRRKVVMRMNPTSIPGHVARRFLLFGAVAGVVLLGGVAAYLALIGPVFHTIHQVSAAPPPAVTAPQASPVPEPPREPQTIAGRVLDFGTGLPIRGTSIWAGATEVVTDGEGRFSLTLAAGQPAVVLAKAPGYERTRVTLGGTV